MTKLSKNYRAAVEKVADTPYAPLEAMKLVKEIDVYKRQLPLYSSRPLVRARRYFLFFFHESKSL